MKTREKSVIVEFTDNGRFKRYVFPIINKDGELMTHRLERLLAGKVNLGERERLRDIHFVGISWHEPCILLEDLNQECSRLMEEIVNLEGHLDLTELIKPQAIPCGSVNDKISFLVRRQLTLRRKLKRKLNEAKKKAY